MTIGLRQLVSAVFLMTFFASSVMAGPGDREAAIRAANEWLRLVDAGQFSESWEHSSSVFRETVPAANWEASLTAVREPLGQEGNDLALQPRQVVQVVVDRLEASRDGIAQEIRIEPGFLTGLP